MPQDSPWPTQGKFTAEARNAGNLLGTGRFPVREGLVVVEEDLSWAVVQPVRLLLPIYGFCVPRPGDALPGAGSPRRADRPDRADGAGPGNPSEIACLRAESIAAQQRECQVNAVVVGLPADFAAVLSFAAGPATADCVALPLPEGGGTLIFVDFSYVVSVEVQLAGGGVMTVAEPALRRRFFRCPGRLEGLCEATVAVRAVSFAGPLTV